jgi:hypothetical protein
MKRMMILATAGAAAALAATSPAAAQRWHSNRSHSNWQNNNWRAIAYTQVNGRDTDTIRVPGTARYRQMRLCVSGGPLEMRDLDLRYRNGGHQDINVRQLMRNGTCTRNIDLSGNRRDITTIRIKYARIGRGWARPTVRVQVR